MRVASRLTVPPVDRIAVRRPLERGATGRGRRGRERERGAARAVAYVAVAQAIAPAGGVRAGVVHLREVRGSLGLELERFQPAARELSRHGSDGGRRDVAARATGAAPHAAPDAGRPPRGPVHGRLSARASTVRTGSRGAGRDGGTRGTPCTTRAHSRGAPRSSRRAECRATPRASGRWSPCAPAPSAAPPWGCGSRPSTTPRPVSPGGRG